MLKNSTVLSNQVLITNPHLNDKTSGTEFDRHYVLHTSWAARKLSAINPIRHVDISSSLYFVGICSAFLPVDFYDYRPANLNLSNLNCYPGNLFHLDFEDSSIDSLSCMHVVEHIGLGRYGDKINPNGDFLAINELKRVISTDGYLLFVVPVGKPCTVFNAHRIYSYEQITLYFHDFELIEFSLIPDNAAEGMFIENASPDLVSLQNYACGCFLFKKKSTLN